MVSRACGLRHGPTRGRPFTGWRWPVCGAGIYLLRRMLFSPLGYALRAARDSAVRADAIGMDVRRIQWTALVIAAALAGVAGALFVFSKGSVAPDSLSVTKSVDALVMVLLGGMQTLAGPGGGLGGVHLVARHGGTQHRLLAGADGRHHAGCWCCCFRKGLRVLRSSCKRGLLPKRKCRWPYDCLAASAEHQQIVWRRAGRARCVADAASR